MNKKSEANRRASIILFMVTILLGLFSLTFPFLLSALPGSLSSGVARVAETPLMLTATLGLALIVLIYELQVGVNTKIIALLGVLVAINASLRFIEIGVPGPGGFSPIFALIILTGYLYGARFGFLIGSLTMLVSALITGGVGPWLPSQMLAAGWVGMSAGISKPFIARLVGRFNNPKWQTRTEILALAIFGFCWGILYGLILTLWGWPFFSNPVSPSSAESSGIAGIFSSFTSFYILTALFWDLSRSIGNVILILALGIPALNALRRFASRLTFHQVQTAPYQKDRPIDFTQEQSGVTQSHL